MTQDTSTAERQSLWCLYSAAPFDATAGFVVVHEPEELGPGDPRERGPRLITQPRNASSRAGTSIAAINHHCHRSFGRCPSSRWTVCLGILAPRPASGHRLDVDLPAQPGGPPRNPTVLAVAAAPHLRELQRPRSAMPTVRAGAGGGFSVVISARPLSPQSPCALCDDTEWGVGSCWPDRVPRGAS